MPQGQAYLHNLAAELRERILLDISAPRDLLHLALTCKALCVQIIPHHLQFRVLRVARYRAEEILTILSEQPLYIISRFRTVDILKKPEEDVLESIPFCLLPPKENDSGLFTTIRRRKTPHEIPSLTISIITKMSNLVNLTLRPLYHFQSILRILSAATPSLAFLDMHNAHFERVRSDSESQEEFNYGSPPWLPLQNLKELRLASFFDVHPTYVKELAHLTPNLSRLELHLYNLDALHAFWEWATWPRLTAMLTYFKRIGGSDTSDLDEDISNIVEDIRMTAALTDFLKRHVGIIHFGLHLRTDIFQLAGPLDNDVLPNLRKLATNIPLYMIVSNSLAPNITHLCCVFHDAPQFWESMTNLTECITHLQYTHIHGFLKTAPKSLQKLVVGELRNLIDGEHDEYSNLYSDEDDEYPDPYSYEREIPGPESFRTLDKLTHLAGSLVVPRDDYSISAALRRELAVLPALTHVGPALNEHLLPGVGSGRCGRFNNGKIDSLIPAVAVFFRKDGVLEDMIEWTSVEDLEVEDEDEAKDNGVEEDIIDE